MSNLKVIRRARDGTLQFRLFHVLVPLQYDALERVFMAWWERGSVHVWVDGWE